MNKIQIINFYNITSYNIQLQLIKFLNQQLLKYTTLKLKILLYKNSRLSINSFTVTYKNIHK